MTAGTPTNYIQKDVVLFDDNATGTYSVNVAADVVPTSIAVNTDKTYSFTGTGKITGATGLTLSSFGGANTGKLVLANTGANDFTGPIAINAGTLQLGDGATAGAGILGLGVVTNTGTLAFNHPEDFAFNNTITGSGGTIVKLGANTLSLVGGDYYGAVNIQAGTLRAAAATVLGTSSTVTVESGATLDVNSQALGANSPSITIAGNGVAVGGSPIGAIVNNGNNAQTAALQQVTLGGDAAVGGTKTWGLTSTLDLQGHTLTKIGANQVTLTDSQVTDGNIVLNEGQITILGNSTVAKNAEDSTNITVNPSTSLQLGGGITIDRAIVLNGGNLVTVGSTTTMTDIASNITVNAGTTTRLLSAGADNVFTGALTGTGTIKVISDNGYFNWQGASSSFAGTYLQGEGLSAWIDGTGSENADYILDYSQTLNQNAILVLGTFGDSATVKLGSLTGLTTTGSLENLGTGNAKFIIGNKVGAGASTTFRGTIIDNSGTLAIEKVGAGTLVLTGQNTYTGGTTVTDGTLQIGNGGATGTAGNGNISLAATTRLVVNRSGVLSIPETISGDGTVVNQGTGTVQLAASNTYTGGTVINAGTVAVLQSVGTTGSPLGTGAVTLAGGQLALQGVLKAGASVTVAGYNQDVVFALSEASASAGTTTSFDAPPGYVFYENGPAHNGGTGGLPSSGTINSAANPNVTFQLAPYTGNNSLQLNDASGSVTFTTPTKLNVLSFLHSSGNGASGVNFTVHFAGTTSTYTDSFTSPDWYGGTPYAISGFSRIDRSTDAYDTNSSDPRLYENDFVIPLDYVGKSITSIDFTTTGGAYFNLLGVSGRQLDPSALASYGNDVVVASDSSISVTVSSQQQLGKLSIGSQKLSLVGDSGAKLILGDAAFTGTPVFDTDAGLTLQLGAVSGGSNGLVKQGAGTLTLAGAVAYSGPTTINAGTLMLNNGTTTTLTTITGAGNLTVAAGSNLNAASINVGALTIGGSGGSAAAVPEPGTLALLAFGVLTAVGLAWKRR